MPSPAWRNRLFRKKLTDRPWSSGDSVNLAVGQGDLQADPLQMAVAYSAIANGGRVVTPTSGCARRTRRDAPSRRLTRAPAPGERQPPVPRRDHVGAAGRRQ